MNRRGFVMLTILWVMSVASIVAMAAVLSGRAAVREGAARVELERARWEALACERRVQAAVDDVLGDAPTVDAGVTVWRTLSRRVAVSPLIVGCEFTLEAAGTRLDVNGASEEMLSNLFAAVGLGDDAQELSEALVDWRDEDDEPHSVGAERPWYENAHRILPRNAPLANTTELHRVKGFESIHGLDSVLSVIPGRVSLATASVSVLMAVPGITHETAEQIASLDAAGSPPGDLLAIIGSVSQQSISALTARYPDAVRATTPDPDAWIAHVTVARGAPKVEVRLDWTLLRAGKHCFVAGTRSTM